MGQLVRLKDFPTVVGKKKEFPTISGPKDFLTISGHNMEQLVVPSHQYLVGSDG